MAALTALAPPRWDEPVAGGRSPREIAGHLLEVDAALRGGRAAAVTRIPPEPGPLIGMNPAALNRVADRPLPDLLDELARSGERLARRVAVLPAALARLPVRGPVGRALLLDVYAWRVLDEWVRVGDVGAGGREDGDGSRAAPVDPERGAVLAEAVLATLPRRVLPRVPRTAGVVRLVVELAGPVTTEEVGRAVGPRRTWAADFARRHYGPRVTAAPDAVVRLTAPALALVTSGRAAWRALGPEDLRVEGEAGLGSDLLDALAPVSTEHPR